MTDSGEIHIEGTEPQKIDDLCDELERHDLSLCAVSEHRWREAGQYRVNSKWLFLFSGLERKAEIRASQGVGFLLNQDMVKAWQQAGEVCEFGGARLIRIRLLIRGRYVSVISCYAPTFNHPEIDKETFYEALGGMMNLLF